MNAPVYDRDFFIKFFSDIPDDKWCVGTRKDHDGRHCALGFTDVEHGYHPLFLYPDFIYPDFIEGSMTQALCKLFNSNPTLYPYTKVVDGALRVTSVPYYKAGACMVVAINNGHSSLYTQVTPKARILAALNDLPADLKPPTAEEADAVLAKATEAEASHELATV